MVLQGKVDSLREFNCYMASCQENDIAEYYFCPLIGRIYSYDQHGNLEDYPDICDGACPSGVDRMDLFAQKRTKLNKIALSLLSLIGAITFFCLNLPILYFVCVSIEIIVGIVIFFYTENFQLKTIDKRFEAYRTYCADVYTWLSGTGLVVTEQNVKEILRRAEQQIERQENSRKEKRETVRHVIDVLVVPFLLAVFSLWMTGKTELEVLLTGAVAILLAVGVFGVIGYQIYSIISFYRKHKLEQWRCFAEDLQGVIDTQLEEKMLINLP